MQEISLLANGVLLPDEIWCAILTHLGYTAIRFATVSQTWKDRIVFNSVSDLSPIINIGYLTRSQNRSRILKPDLNDKFIRRFGSLRYLDLSEGHSITDYGIRSLKNLSTLILNSYGEDEDYDVQYYGMITYEGIKDLINITHLDISGNHKIFDEGIKRLTNITRLEIHQNKNITNEGIKDLINIKTLNLSYQNIITDEGIKVLTNITDLSLNEFQQFPTNITDEGLKLLTNITTLSLEYNMRITYESLKILTNITDLKLSQNEIIKNCSLRLLPNLTTLDLS
jgi:hypothetical protein